VFRGGLAIDGAALESLRRAMEQPQPRVALGQALRGVATSAIDVSDGLLGDLGHILQRSQLGATLEVDVLPRSAVLRTLPAALQREFTLAGGDDYELVFSAPPSRAADVTRAASASGVVVTRIGRLDAEPGLRLVDANGAAVANGFGSFDHFKS
jgi:thiamine-monophosphate kinase